MKKISDLIVYMLPTVNDNKVVLMRIIIGLIILSEGIQDSIQDLSDLQSRR